MHGWTASQTKSCEFKGLRGVSIPAREPGEALTGV